MSSNRGIVTQEAMVTVERLASLCATPGIDEKTKEIANEQIRKLLDGPIKMAVTEIATASAGIVTLSK